MRAEASAANSQTAFAGRHVLVTGASRGIGWAIARRFAAHGAVLSLVSRERTALQARCAELGGAARGFAADLGAGAAGAAAVAEAIAENGAIDILVNNAGLGLSQPFAKMDAAHWDSMIALNLTSVFHVTRAAIPAMLAAGQGRIVNIASTAGLTGYPYVAAYCAAKHGVIGMTRALAREYAKTGITVNAVCPGYVETDMTAASIANIVAKTGRSEADARQDLAKLNPQGRLVQPDEVADAVLWLAAPGSAAITGQAIAVAGGEVMP